VAPSIMIALIVLTAGFCLVFYTIGQNIGRKLGRKEGEDKANRAVIERAKKHGYNMTEIYVKLIGKED
jgi:hypothetical protein